MARTSSLALLSAAGWESFLSGFPQAHLLQTAAWGDLKSGFGWSVERVGAGAAGAQILFRRLPLGLSLAYIPKGPVGGWLPALLPELHRVCREQRAFALKIEPDAADDPSLAAELQTGGFVFSRHTIQPRRTLVVDLTGSEDEILARMHQKTRYNIRLAGRKGVVVRPWSDVDGFAHMMAETAARDQFGAHVPGYYRQAYGLFHPSRSCELLMAEEGGRPLAALMAFARDDRAWYLFGASTAHERQRMPTYLLQWEAMRWARSRGCSSYDLWGVPDEEADTLEANFPGRSDGLWGVYRFKRGFGGRLVRSIGAWDCPYHRPLYAAYRLVVALGQGKRWS